MLSNSLEITLNLAVQHAQHYRHEYVSIEHVLYALLENPEASEAFVGCGGSVETLRKDLEDYFENYLQTNVLPNGKHPQPTIGFKRILQRAAQQVHNPCSHPDAVHPHHGDPMLPAGRADPFRRQQ